MPTGKQPNLVICILCLAKDQRIFDINGYYAKMACELAMYAKLSNCVF